MPRREEALAAPLIDLINRHFQLDVSVDESSRPVVAAASPKQCDSLAQFVNGVIQLLDEAGLPGAVTYYYGGELDYETPEEMHRY